MVGRPERRRRSPRRPRPPPAVAPPSAAALARHLLRASRARSSTLGAPSRRSMRGAARVTAGHVRRRRRGGRGASWPGGWRGGGERTHGRPQAALTLCADHELNVSAFTARCVASADPAWRGGPRRALRPARPPARRPHRAGRGPVRDAGRDGPPGRPSGRSATMARCRGSATRCTPRATPAPPSCCALAAASGRIGGDRRALVALARGPARPVAHPRLRPRGAGPPARAPRGAAFCLFALGRSAGGSPTPSRPRADSRLIRPRARYVGAPPTAVSP